MSFLEFLRGFDGGWLQREGFLDVALGDSRFTDIWDWTGLDIYLVTHDADARTREEARSFWDEYERSKKLGWNQEAR
jgi:hypothetical protein